MKYFHKWKSGLGFAILMAVIISSQTVIFAETPDIAEFSRKTLEFNCPKIDIDVDLNVYFKELSTGSEAAPVVVYIQNYNYPRVGLEGDSSIISDLINQRYIVITADFKNSQEAYSPYFDADLNRIFKGVYGRSGVVSILAGLNIEPARYLCYFLPAGYRIIRNVEFWDIKKHSAEGTMGHIVSTYNQFIVPQFGKSPVDSADDMVGVDGSPISDNDYKLYMDIVYPSQSAEDVPLIINAASNHERNPNGHPDQMRMHISSFLMRGYAAAFVAHCFNPLTYQYGYFGSFTLDPFDGLASNTAAVRFLRASADTYNLDTNLFGAWGHSKAAYAVTRLSDPNHEGQPEHKVLVEGGNSLEPQPWQGYSSQISVGYQSMGFGTMEHKYVKSDYVPTIIAVGEFDPYGCWEDWPALVDTYENLDVNHLALKMYGLGHELPYGYDENLKIDRYDACQTFFDRYLKIKEDLPPAVLYAIGSDKAIVHFAPEMDSASVIAGIDIINASTEQVIQGQWQAYQKDTKFVFTPEDTFISDETYKIIIKTTVKDKSGIFIEEEKVFEFDNSLNCGDYGYLPSDFNQDCNVNLEDFYQIAGNFGFTG